jgi:hypothetical protein
MTGDAEAAGEPEIAVEVAYPDRIAPGDGRKEHLQLGIGQRSFFFLQRRRSCGGTRPGVILERLVWMTMPRGQFHSDPHVICAALSLPAQRVRRGVEQGSRRNKTT